MIRFTSSTFFMLSDENKLHHDFEIVVAIKIIDKYLKIHFSCSFVIDTHTYA